MEYWIVKKRYKYQSEPITEQKGAIIFKDFAIQTDRKNKERLTKFSGLRTIKEKYTF